MLTRILSSNQHGAVLFNVLNLVLPPKINLKNNSIPTLCIRLLHHFALQSLFFLRFCPRGDPSGIHHSLCGITLNLKWFTHRAINENLSDKHISNRQQECQSVSYRQWGTWGRIIDSRRLKVCWNLFVEQGVRRKRWYLCPCCARGAVMNGAV